MWWAARGGILQPRGLQTYPQAWASAVKGAENGLLEQGLGSWLGKGPVSTRSGVAR